MISMCRSVLAIAAAAVLAGACSSGGGRAEPKKERPAAAGKAPAKAAIPDDRPEKVERRLLLLGLDGATWDVMDPLLEGGRLPAFAKLIERGVRAPLGTFRPCLSPLIWTTIATGVGPRIHGILGFTAQLPGTDEQVLVTSNVRRVKALWNILSEAGHTVGVAGWWATYPAEKVDGFVISDQASRLRKENYKAVLDVADWKTEEEARRATWPPDLADELADELMLSPEIDPARLARFMDVPEKEAAALRSGGAVDDENILSIFKFAYLIDETFIRSSLKAIGKARPDFAAVYLNGLDAAEHHFWKYREPERFEGVPAEDVKRYGRVIDEYYVYMDEVLGRFLEEYPLDETIVVVVSDHGHSANPSYDPSSEDHFDRVCSGTHDHAPDGVIVVSGKDVVPGARVRATVADVTPTILALMGLPVGEDMPGSVLTGAIDPAFLAAHPVRRVPTHSAGYRFSDVPVRSVMGEALKKKLQGLGYIE